MEDYSPRVSIVIPVYNGSDYLKDSIESALAQTYCNLEIIVVNDGSDDRGLTESIAKSYGDRISYYRKENGGVSSALNYGISKMNGEWFSWLSHDDTYLPEKVEAQIDYLNQKIIPSLGDKDVLEVMLYADTEFINERGDVILRLKPIAKEFESQRDIVLKNLKHNRLGGCSFLVSKKAIVSVGGFDESIRTVSDYDLWYRLILSGYNLYYVPRTLVQGRMHRNQVTYRMSETGILEFEQFHTWLLERLDKMKDYDNWDVFFKIACYARQRGYFKSSDIGFKMMKKRTYKITYILARIIGGAYSDLYRLGRRAIKLVYSAFYIK